MSGKQALKKYEALKKKLTALGYICSGSVMSLYRKCGKPNCACCKDKKALHGPYHIWTRKVDGKTVTRTLSPAQAGSCKDCIDNLQKMVSIVEKMKLLSAQAVDQLET